MKDREWVAKWLSKAQGDLLVAQHVFYEFNPKQLDISCYHCQQSAEKALEAYLTFQEYNFPYTHDLRQLCQLCMNFDNSFSGLLDDCFDLMPYAAQTRYPAMHDIEEAETESALNKAERILKAVASLIS